MKLARRLGATVRITSLVGFGFPDVVIGFRGINLLAEGKLPDTNPLRPVKPRKNAKPRKLTKTEENQARFRAEWGGQVTVIESAADVVALLTAADTVRRIREGMIFDEAYQRAKADMAALVGELVDAERLGPGGGEPGGGRPAGGGPAGHGGGGGGCPGLFDPGLPVSAGDLNA